MSQEEAPGSHYEFQAGEFCLTLRTNPRTGVQIAYKERHPDYTTADIGHEFWELLYVDKGQIQFYLDEKAFKVSQGEFVVILPYQKHGVGPSGTIAPFYITAHFDTNLKSLRSLGNRILRVDEEGRRLLVRMLEENASNEIGSFGLVRCYLAEFLIKSKRLQAKDGAGQRVGSFFQVNAEKQVVGKAISHMTSNLDRPLSLQDIAKAVGVSRSHLEHAFKKSTGSSVMSHLQELRIEKAKKLLLESSLNISGIAAECGYSSLHLFSRRFKKWVSVCPTEYARMVRSALPIPSNRKQT